jgi:RNA polymerase sigma factor (sigma-70 family)
LNVNADHNLNSENLIPHLFRTESRKIVSVLCKFFGIEHAEAAEDIASETFLAALETWPYKGVPSNPTAWLYAVAKNKAMNYVSRNQLFVNKIASHLQPLPDQSEIEVDLSNINISDSQLQMMFALCHPAIPAEAQIGLALRILCGFGIDEIATALLSNKETINKRLFRAREKLRIEKIRIEFPHKSEIQRRLETVLTTLYLLFNEGYYSESQDTTLKRDLCEEAMGLTHLLIEHEQTDLPPVHALYSLMCFHSSRFNSREGKNGEMILYQDQDETLWDRELISKGAYHLHRASRGDKISKYHIEAAIAYWHTIKEDTAEKWENILQLFNQLLQIEYSPVAALNRTFALSKVNGKQAAIAEAEKLKLTGNHFYFMLLGELYKEVDSAKSKMNYQQALSLAKTQEDKRIIQKRIDLAG